MASFAARLLRRSINRRYSAPLYIAYAAAVGVSAIAPASVRADTQGGSGYTGQGILAQLGFPGLFNNDGPPQTAVDTNSTRYGFVANEYVALVLGYAGSFTKNYGNNTSITFNVPGRFSIGNLGGSLRPEIPDDQQSLVGDNFGDGALFPLASDFTSANAGFDMTAYAAVNVDPTAAAPAGSPAALGITNSAFVQNPTFVNNSLTSVYSAPNNVQVRQTFKLRRSNVRMEFVLTNTDTVTHSVGLQITLSQANTDYYIDGQRGRTRRPFLYTGSNVPSRVDYVTSQLNPGYHSRATLRGYDATPPDRVLTATINRLFPANFYFADQNFVDQIPTIFSPNDGSAAPGLALYWDAVAIPPGGSRTIVTYYGNGAPTETFDSDYVIGTEATESLGYNANTATATNPSATAPITAAADFLTPNPFTIYGGIYNQTQSDPDKEVVLNNVSLSLTLPTGLKFGPIGTGTDTSAKSIGTLRGDKQGTAQWVVAPTGERYGALVYQVTGSAPPLGSRTISRTINVPATPLRFIDSADWNLISFPFQFDPVLSNNGDPSTVVNGITKPNDSPTFYRWVPDDLSTTGDGKYVIVDKLEPGIAYFYRPQIPRVVFVNGAKPVDNQAPATGLPQPQAQTIGRGWNMIGNPYVYDIPLAYLRIVPLENNPNLTSYTFAEAVTAGYVRGGVFFYNSSSSGGNSQYDFLSNYSDPLKPWFGYWLYANTRLNLQYNNPTSLNTEIAGSAFTGSGRSAKIGAIASGRALVTNATTDNWKLQLVARRDDGRVDDATLIGVVPGAKDGDDITDLPKPPVFKDYVYVSVIKEGTTTRAFAQDLKAAGGSKSWDVEVMADKSGKVTLSWPNMGQLPRRLNLKATDLATGKSVSLRSASSVVFDATASVPHRFRITADTAATRPLAITGLRSTKSGGRGQDSGYAIGFNLSAPATVTGRVLTLGNKVVRTIGTGRAATAGENTLRWDGRAEDGNKLPAGPYVVEITARGEDGTLVPRRAPLLILN